MHKPMENFRSDVKWSARIAYTWQQALDVTDPSGSEYKDEIPYTPNQSGSGMAAVYYKNWNAGYSILFSGERYALGENDPTNLLPAGMSRMFLYLLRSPSKIFKQPSREK